MQPLSREALAQHDVQLGGGERQRHRWLFDEVERAASLELSHAHETLSGPTMFSEDAGAMEFEYHLAVEALRMPHSLVTDEHTVVRALERQRELAEHRMRMQRARSGVAAAASSAVPAGVDGACRGLLPPSACPLRRACLAASPRSRSGSHARGASAGIVAVDDSQERQRGDGSGRRYEGDDEQELQTIHRRSDTAGSGSGIGVALHSSLGRRSGPHTPAQPAGRDPTAAGTGSPDPSRTRGAQLTLSFDGPPAAVADESDDGLEPAERERLLAGEWLGVAPGKAIPPNYLNHGAGAALRRRLLAPDIARVERAEAEAAAREPAAASGSTTNTAAAANQQRTAGAVAVPVPHVASNVTVVTTTTGGSGDDDDDDRGDRAASAVGLVSPPRTRAPQAAPAATASVFDATRSFESHSSRSRSAAPSYPATPMTPGTGGAISQQLRPMRGIDWVLGLDPDAMDAVAFAEPVAAPLSGELPVMDVVMRVLLWLPAQQTTLLAVSGVCAGWRAAARRLPQWALVPQLFRPNPRLATAMQVMTQAGDPLSGLRLGMTETDLGAVDRDGYVAAMQERWKCKQRVWELTRQRKHEGVSGSVGLQLVFFAFSAAAVTVAMAASYFIMQAFTLKAYRELGEDETLADWQAASSVDSNSFLAFMIAGLEAFILGTAFHVLPNCWCWHLLTNQQRNRRRRTAIVLFAVVLGCVLHIGVPFGLASARYTQAKALVNAPVYAAGGFDHGACSLLSQSGAASDIPAFVQLPDFATWHLRPWADGRATPFVVDFEGDAPHLETDAAANATNITRPANTFRRAARQSISLPARVSLLAPCAAPAGADLGRWWAAEYAAHGHAGVSRNGTRQCWDVHAAPGDAAQGRGWRRDRYVLLYPPADVRAACGSGAGPVAVTYAPGAWWFEALVAGVASRQAGVIDAAGGSGVRRTYRTARASVYFDAGCCRADGARWFECGSADNHTASSSSTGNSAGAPRPWVDLGIPLVVPVPLDPGHPEAVAAAWAARQWAVALVALVVTTAGIAIGACVPRATLSSWRLNIVNGAVLLVALNPLWMVGWGAGCLARPDTDLCMVSATGAMLLLFTGLFLACAAGGCAFVSLYRGTSDTRRRVAAGKRQ